MRARAQRKVAILLRYYFLLGLLSLNSFGVAGASRHVEDAVLNQLLDRLPPTASPTERLVRVVRNNVGEVTSLWLDPHENDKVPVLTQETLDILAGLNRLDSLDLAGARVEQPARLPDSWATLKRLLLLRVDMPIGGTLPKSWAAPGAFPRLQSMVLTNCDLEGSLPAEWGRPGALPQLQELFISNSSRLGGTLPPSWAEGFPSLQTLGLKGLGVADTLPSTWLTRPAFPSLEDLHLSDCNITGSLPEEISLQSLTRVDFTGCQLTGTLPAWQAGAGQQLNYLLLARNRLSGPVPASWLMAGLPNLVNLDLAHNMLTSFTRDPGCAGGGSALYSLFLSHNSFSGRLPWSEEGCRGSPVPSLKRLALDGNCFSGDLPTGWPELFPNLTDMLLGSNSLTGPIPASWAEPAAFVELEYLDLSLNQLTGPVPERLLSKPKLVKVNLTSNHISGTLPAWKGDPSNTDSFMLDLSNNHLTGSIPESWTNHRWRDEACVFLNFSHNELEGPFPTSWDLKAHPAWWQWSAVNIDIHNNKLTGSLPWQLFDGGNIHLAASPGNEDLCITERPATLPTVVAWESFEAPMRGGGLCSLQELIPDMPSAQLCFKGEEHIRVCPSGASQRSGIPPLWPLSFMLAVLAVGAYVLVLTRKMRFGAHGLPPGMSEDCEAGAALPLLPETMSQVTVNLVERLLSSPAVRLTTASPPPREMTDPPTSSETPPPGTTDCKPWHHPLGPSGSTASRSLAPSADSSVPSTAAASPAGSASTVSTADYVLAQYRKEMEQQKVQGEGGCRPGLGPSSMLRRLRLADLSFVRDSQGSLVVLGRGSFATVLEARLWGTQRVAVKVAERSDMAAVKLVQEAELLHGCYHPNVLQVFGTCTAGELVFLVSELMERGTLAANLHSDQLKWGARGRQVLLEVAQGLDYLHSIGVLHGDLKPANILLSEKFQVKIADVGSAHHLVRSEAPACGGTVMFAAPEQLLGQTCTKKADVFSLGLVMLSVLVGGQPRGRGQYREIDLRTYPGCPPELADIISACLKEDPAARPTTQQLIGQLLACQ